MIEQKEVTGHPLFDTIISFIVGAVFGIFNSIGTVTWESFTSIKNFPLSELQDIIFWSIVCGFFSMLGSRLLGAIWDNLKQYIRERKNNQNGMD